MATLFKNGQIISGSGKVIDKGWVLIEKNTIVAVGSTHDLPPKNADGVRESIDLNGMSLLPGMIDTHVHITADGSPNLQAQIINDGQALTAVKMLKNCRQTLNAGFTTVRDLGGRNYVNLEVRDALNAGLMEGPTVVSCGRVVCMTGGHGWFMGNEADGPDQVRRAVREELKQGVDLVKFMSTGGVLTKGVDPHAPQLGLEELRAGIEEAHNAGRKTTTHAIGMGGIKNAVEAGIDCIEHGFFLSEELAEQMAKKDVWLVPTLVPVIRLKEYEVVKFLPDWVNKKVDDYGETWKMGILNARKAGVKIAMGTDTGTPFNLHGQNAQELIHMVDAGLIPQEAIASVTSRAAELLGLEHELGSLVPGKKADFVIVDGNPLEDISVLADQSKIRMVYKNGIQVTK